LDPKEELGFCKDCFITDLGIVDDVVSGVKDGVQFVSSVANLVTDPLNPVNWLDGARSLVSVTQDISKVGTDIVGGVTALGQQISTTKSSSNSQSGMNATVLNTMSVPTGFSNSVTNADFRTSYVKYVDANDPLAQEITVVRQSIVTGTDVTFPASHSPSGLTKNQEYFLYPYGTFGDRIDNITDSFDHYAITDLTVSFVNQTTTDVDGSLHIILRDKAVAITGGSPAGISKENASQFKQTYGNVWNNHYMNVPCRGEWLLTGDSGTAGDIHWYANKCISICTGGNLSSGHAGVIGNIQFDVVMKFRSPKAPAVSFFSKIVTHPWMVRIANAAMRDVYGFDRQAIRNVGLTTLNIYGILTKQYLQSKDLSDGVITNTAQYSTKLLHNEHQSHDELVRQISAHLRKLFADLAAEYIDNIDMLVAVISCFEEICTPRLFKHKFNDYRYWKMQFDDKLLGGLKLSYDPIIDKEYGLLTFLRFAIISYLAYFPDMSVKFKEVKDFKIKDVPKDQDSKTSIKENYIW
jgi:hypothetical protein